MEPDELFVETVEDLRTRTHLRATEYDVTQASGLIRRLLLDRTPLAAEHVDLASLRFELTHAMYWVDHSLSIDECDEPCEMLATGYVLDPTLSGWLMSQLRFNDPATPAVEDITRSLNLDEFCSLEVVTVWPDRTRGVTLKQFVKHFSNREGGVHFGAGGFSTNPVLEAHRVSQAERFRQILVGIGRVVLRALEPTSTEMLVGSTLSHLIAPRWSAVPTRHAPRPLGTA